MDVIDALGLVGTMSKFGQPCVGQRPQAQTTCDSARPSKTQGRATQLFAFQLRASQLFAGKLRDLLSILKNVVPAGPSPSNVPTWYLEDHQPDPINRQIRQIR